MKLFKKLLLVAAFAAVAAGSADAMNHRHAPKRATNKTKIATTEITNINNVVGDVCFDDVSGLYVDNAGNIVAPHVAKQWLKQHENDYLQGGDLQNDGLDDDLGIEPDPVVAPAPQNKKCCASLRNFFKAHPFVCIGFLTSVGFLADGLTSDFNGYSFTEMVTAIVGMIASIYGYRRSTH